MPRAVLRDPIAPGDRVDVWLGPDKRGTLLVLGALPDGSLVVHLVGASPGSVHLVEPKAVAAGAAALEQLSTTPAEWVGAWLDSQGGPIHLAEQTEAVVRRHLR